MMGLRGGNIQYRKLGLRGGGPIKCTFNKEHRYHTPYSRKESSKPRYRKLGLYGGSTDLDDDESSVNATKPNEESTTTNNEENLETSTSGNDNENSEAVKECEQNITEADTSLETESTNKAEDDKIEDVKEPSKFQSCYMINLYITFDSKLICIQHIFMI